MLAVGGGGDPSPSGPAETVPNGFRIKRRRDVSPSRGHIVPEMSQEMSRPALKSELPTAVIHKPERLIHVRIRSRPPHRAPSAEAPSTTPHRRHAKHLDKGERIRRLIEADAAAATAAFRASVGIDCPNDHAPAGTPCWDSTRDGLEGVCNARARRAGYRGKPSARSSGDRKPDTAEGR